MANHPPYHYLDIGIAGEDLVAEWLQSKGWVILHRRWRYRNGEIDIIAQFYGEAGEAKDEGKASSSPVLAFVEVKTRSRENWDAGGRNAITKHKQVKLWDTALMFLAKYPEKANYPCRFDVAIVSCQPISQGLAAVTISPEAIPNLSSG
ncbi:YraN family protein [Mastigocladopsis repens]|uniref:YraN family protein n=1 Tax=Mastigocladopsis repens TaxID=221287 RepID=UPI00036FC02B|nr:YraN family protein [Mastigocladopsis repens]